MGYRVDIYARLSRDRDGQTSTLRQERDARSFARLRGWDVAQVHTDLDTSAYRKGVTRPGYERLLARVRAREVDGVLVWKLDRLVRRAAEFERFWTVAEDAGVFLASVNEPIDTTNELGLTIVRILVAFAQLESATMSMRIQSAKRAAAEAGRPPRSGQRPFGLDVTWTTVVPEEATVIVECADRILAGASLRSVTRDLNARGVQSVKQRPWTPRVLRSILISPRIAGLRAHNGEIVGVGEWPAMLDGDVWRRLCAVLADPSRKLKAGRPPAHLLAGLARCGRCGARIHCHLESGHHVRTYHCPPAPRGCAGVAIVADAADAEIAGRVFARLDVGRLELDRPEPAPDLTVAVEAVEAELAATARAYAEGELRRDGYAAAARALQERLDGLRAQITASEATRATGALVDDTAGIEDRWDAMPLPARRDLLAALIDQVTIQPAAPGPRNVFQPDRLRVLWRA
jgi:site-specific DNA recombinase